MTPRTPRSLLLLGSLALVLAACVQGGSPNPTPTPTADLSIGAPQEGQSLAGTVIAIAGGVGGTARNLSFTLGDLEVDADPDGTAILDTRSLADGSYTLTANATVDGQAVSDSVDVTVTNDLPDSGTVGPQGGTLKSQEGSYATLPPGALDDEATLTLVDTTQQQILDDFGVDYNALGVTFLGSLTVDATGTTATRTNRPVSIDLAGWAQAVQPQQDVVMFNVLPDADGDGVGELTFASTARATPDGSVVTVPTPRAEVYGFGSGSASLRLQQATTVRPGQLITLQGRGLTPHSPLGNTARFPDGNEILVAPTDLEQGAANPLQVIVVAVPDLGAGSTQITLRNGSTGFVSEPLALQIGSAGSGIQSDWDAFVEQLHAALQGVTDGRPGLLALGSSFLNALPDEATLKAMAVRSALVSTQNLALLEGIGAGSYGPDQRDLVARHALLLDAMAVTAGSAAAAELASLLMVATPTDPDPSLAALRGQQNSGGSCSGPSAPVFWGTPSPTGMGSAPPGGCSAGGTGGSGGGGSPLRGQRLGGFGPVEGAVIRVRTLDGENLLSPFTALTDAAGQFFIPFMPPGEPFRLEAIDPATGDRAEAVGVAGGVGELSAVNLAFAPAVANPGDPVASFTFTETAPGAFAFDATASFDPDGEIVEYIWNFGDGTIESLWDTAERDFPFAGTFTVSLTVIDDAGNSGATQRTLPTLAPIYPIELVAVDAYEPDVAHGGGLVGFSAYDPMDGTATALVWDPATGSTLPVATDADGAPLPSDDNLLSDLGGEGRYALFEDVSGSDYRLFLKDLQTGELVEIGVDTAAPSCDGLSLGGPDALSGDGRHLGLLCSSGFFDPNVGAYLLDLEADTLAHLNTQADGTPADPQKGRSVLPDFDGSVALFRHQDADLSPNDSNGEEDLYLKDLGTGAVDLATVRSNGDPILGDLTWTPGRNLSDDGRYVAFVSWDDAIVPSDTNERADVFVHDLATGDVTRASTRQDGSEFPSGVFANSGEAVLSGDGRYLLFRIVLSELDPFFENGGWALVVKDLQSGEVAWVDRTDLGKQPDDQFTNSTFDIGSDGRWIVFDQFALVADAVTGDRFGISAYRVENPLWEAAP